MTGRRRPMPVAVASRFDADLDAARRAVQLGDLDRAWTKLEEAHVLSQPWAWPHIKVHSVMLRVGWRSGDRREVLGQVLRLMFAGPGSLTGRYPEGNTGRADVPATRPMSMPDDIRDLLGVGRG